MIVTNGSTLWESNVAFDLGNPKEVMGKLQGMGDFPAMELMTKGYTDTPWKPKKHGTQQKGI
jgi:hypothetical protein